MTDIRVFSGDPGLVELLKNGAGFNIILQAHKQLEIPLGEGVLLMVGAPTSDRGRPNKAVELPNGIDDLRTRWGGFNRFIGDGPATGYNGNLYARVKGATVPRTVLQPVDLALKDKTISDPTAVDLKLTIARAAMAFTLEADDEKFTLVGHPFAAGDTFEIVTLTGGTGAAVATPYRVLAGGLTSSTFTAEALDGTDLAITLDGSGVLRPLTVASGMTLAAVRMPAGTRVANAGGTFVVRLLEDLEWSENVFVAKTVRIAKVSGTEAAINTVKTFADIVAAEFKVVTTATTVPDGIDSAELQLRYQRAFDTILNTPAGQAANVIVCDRDEAAYGDMVAAHCRAARNRGYFRRGAVAPPVGTTSANVQLTSGDGIGRATLDREMVVYVYPGVCRSFLDDADNLNAADNYQVTLSGAFAYAIRMANTPPWENPSRPHASLGATGYGILALEPLLDAEPSTMFRAGIVVPEFARQAGGLAASFRDGILANKAKIQNERMKEYLATGSFQNSESYHKELGNPTNQELVQDAIDGFLTLVQKDEHIGEFALARSYDADNSHLRVDIAALNYGTMDTITLGLDVSGKALEDRV